MNTQNKNPHDALQTRINRAAGQVSSLSEQIARGDCQKTLIQFKAARAALDSAYALFLEKHLTACIESKDSETLSEIISSISKK